MLGVTRESPKADISKSYRKLAGKWHPDRFRKKEEKEEAEKTFLKIAAAYDVLKDEESREEYNYMLDHPEEMWRNMYRYYRRRVGPKVSRPVTPMARHRWKVLVMESDLSAG